jgi:membrane protease YdiL (CAAX protease family)
MTTGRFMTTATWPSAPAIRGRDLTWVAALGVVGVLILLAIMLLLETLDTGPSIPANAPDFDTWPDGTASDFWAVNFMIGAFYVYIALVVYAVLVRPRRQNWRDLGFQMFDMKWLAATLALGGILFVSGEWITGLLELNEQAEAYNRDLFATKDAGVSAMGVQLLLIGPATAIIEETCFRGLLHRWIRQNVGRILGVSLSAAIFSAVHFGFVDPGGVLGWYWTAEVFAFGAVLALLYEWSGSLWPPILLHAANNVAAVTLAYMAG